MSEHKSQRHSGSFKEADTSWESARVNEVAERTALKSSTAADANYYRNERFCVHEQKLAELIVPSGNVAFFGNFTESVCTRSLKE